MFQTNPTVFTGLSSIHWFIISLFLGHAFIYSTTSKYKLILYRFDPFAYVRLLVCRYS